MWCVGASWDGKLAISGGGDGVKLWDLGRYRFAASISFMLSKSGAGIDTLVGKALMEINNQN